MPGSSDTHTRIARIEQLLNDVKPRSTREKIIVLETKIELDKIVQSLKPKKRVTFSNQSMMMLANLTVIKVDTKKN